MGDMRHAFVARILYNMYIKSYNNENEANLTDGSHGVSPNDGHGTEQIGAGHV